MTVMCISHNERWSNEPWTSEDPQVGDECTVVEKRLTVVDSFLMLLYKIAEGREDCWYDSICFATLPESTATELYEQEFEGVMQ